MFNETVYKDRPYEQWTVNVNSIRIGKYQYANPGQASFQINDDGIGLPTAIYDNVLKGRSLGGKNGLYIRFYVDSIKSKCLM